jgi:hypothetical protein
MQKSYSSTFSKPHMPYLTNQIHSMTWAVLLSVFLLIAWWFIHVITGQAIRCPTINATAMLGAIVAARRADISTVTCGSVQDISILGSVTFVMKDGDV